MINKKDYFKGLSLEEMKFLHSLAKIYVQSIVKQAEEQNLLPSISKRIS